MKKTEYSKEGITFLGILKGLLFIVVFFGLTVFLGNLVLVAFVHIADYVVQNVESKVILFILFVLLCLGIAFGNTLSKASEYGFSSGRFLSGILKLKKRKERDDEK
ncbi:MAG: hypothetical protein SD837_19155 [Candidatus Electrothrix scaldis]|nr:MAG: hypothetical protein SD837_19155 [Candidatus Electrothrix sp. GW3-3]